MYEERCGDYFDEPYPCHCCSHDHYCNLYPAHLGLHLCGVPDCGIEWGDANYAYPEG